MSLRDPLRRGQRDVSLGITGKAAVSYQLVTTHYRRRERDGEDADLDVVVAYDARQLAVGEVLSATITLEWNRETAANMTMVEIPVPPGFSVDIDALDSLRRTERIAQYETRGDVVSLYLRRLPGKQKVELPYRLIATQPVRAQAPPVVAYQYYEPEVRSETRAAMLTVR